ncbi:MAG: CZB domain-containing protein [Campylobacterales bacterium]|nr:CZB domain-containing protein [Campylobacterales bacterium]
MKRDETLLHLREAKKAHIKWVHRAKALTEGFPVEKDAIPMDSTDCAFGLWFYGEGQALGMLPNMDCFKEIELKHNALHDTYMKIFKIYFGEFNRSFLSKLFNLKKQISAVEQQAAADYFAQLKKISDELLVLIERLERRVGAISESELESIF